MFSIYRTNQKKLLTIKNEMKMEYLYLGTRHQLIEDAMKLVSYEAKKGRYFTALDELEILESEVKQLRKWLEEKAIENDVNNEVSGKDNE